MSIKSQQRVSIWHQCALAGMLAVAMSAMATAASAGECPLDKKVADGQGQKPGPSTPTGVTDTVRASTDLSKEPLALKGRLLRLRELDVAPGGIVPWHSHQNRPAQIYVVSGEIVEYASNCALPIVHKAGDVAPERNGTQHWWKNEGTVPVVLISVDLFPVEAKMDPHTM
ncbi:cupin domain-containing protein [Paraburkholderia sp. 40]|uniref:cupin domain-containing protein n=1 Tax=Paraburkholderia sp. 40 TaxID=2991059 RepID=UPI003D20EFE2